MTESEKVQKVKANIVEIKKLAQELSEDELAQIAGSGDQETIDFLEDLARRLSATRY